MSLELFSKELIEYILQNDPKSSSINNMKIIIARKYSLSKIPLHSEILKYTNPENRNAIKKKLVVKDVRSKSGVSVVALMPKPEKCPHGKCIYCPGGIEQNVPQSYTGAEPATMRAIANKFDPYLQVKNRINQLESVGHDVSKIELIIMGGTFNAGDKKYQKEFVKRIYDALNNKDSNNLEDAKQLSEKSKYRPIGLTIETRPDLAKEKEIKELLDFGATRVELGVQTLSDKIYTKVNRGHTLNDVVEATKLLKDSGFKVLYHVMPGLFSTVAKDKKIFKRLFLDSRFRPDMLKIYPCLVLPNTKLFDLWKLGKFKPYSDEDLFNFLKSVYPKIPYWVRVMRIQRDIPSTKISKGPTTANMREIVLEYFSKRKIPLKEIRARQIGIKETSEKEYAIFIEKYKASKGTEFFISYESKNREQIVGFIRLRFPYKPFISNLKNNTAIIRELHVYGNVVPVDVKATIMGQHTGIGKMLLRKAEEIAKENSFKKLAIISGIGVREYYYKQGYFLDGAYVSKYL